MSVEITAAQDEAICRHGAAGYPNEICGVLLGREAGGHKTVADLLPIDNQFESEERYHRFLITPQDMLRAEKYGARPWIECGRLLSFASQRRSGRVGL